MGHLSKISSLGQIADHLKDITDWMTPYVGDLIGYKVRVNTFDGKIKGIPYDVDPAMLFYRGDILEEAGIDIASIVTYDDLINAAIELKSKHPEMYPIHIETTAALIVLWVSMLANQQGTSFINADGELMIESPEFLNIMNFIKSALDNNVGNLSTFVGADDIAACDQNIQVFYPWAIWFNYQVDALLKDSRGKWRVTGCRSGRLTVPKPPRWAARRSSSPKKQRTPNWRGHFTNT